jgi:hypothetical protein
VMIQERRKRSGNYLDAAPEHGGYALPIWQIGPLQRLLVAQANTALDLFQPATIPQLEGNPFVRLQNPLASAS